MGRSIATGPVKTAKWSFDRPETRHAAAAAELPSFAGYVVLLHAVFGALCWRDSFLITMAGVAATRLLATAGAGGIAMTSWALHRLGLPARSVGRGIVAFLG